MKQYIKSAWPKWLLAALVGIGAGALRHALVPLIGINGPYLVLYPLVMAIAVSLGFVPGIITALIGSFFAETWHIEPIGVWQMSSPSMIRIILIVIGSSYVGHVGQVLRKARNQAQADAAMARISKEKFRVVAESLRATSLLLGRRAADAQESQRILEALMEHIPMGIAVADGTEANIRMVSRWGRDLLGLTKEEFPGAAVEEFAQRWDICPIDGSPPDPGDLPLARAAKRGEVVREEVWMVKDKEGRRIPILCTAAPIDDEKGHILGGVIGWQDVSERMEIESRLKEVAEELNRSNRDLEQFAYIASHDLQEPLRMISGYLDLFWKRYQGQLDKDGEEFIGFALDGAHRMHRLIKDLLAYSLVGSQGKQPKVTALAKVLAEVLASQRAAIQEGGVLITHDPLPEVWADEVQMIQLFTNLVGNALKFRQVGEPRVHVGVEGRRGEWVFSVQDNGIGIDPKFHDRIFMIFQRLHDQTAYPGSGIGLAICKKIVERHGGRMWVESQKGEGTMFFFTLPRREEFH